MAPMTPLRKRMFEDMQLRNLASKTQSNYIHYIRVCPVFPFGPVEQAATLLTQQT